MGIKSINYRILTNEAGKVVELGPNKAPYSLTEEVFTLHPTGEHVLVFTALNQIQSYGGSDTAIFIKEWKSVNRSTEASAPRPIPILELPDATEVTVVLRTALPYSRDEYGTFLVSGMAVFMILD